MIKNMAAHKTRTIRKTISALAIIVMLSCCAIPCAAYAEDSTETTHNEADTLGVGGVGGQSSSSQYAYDQEQYDAISDLLNVDEGMDNKIVTIKGEVVGEATIADNEHQWVAVSQDGWAISVYMDNDVANKIQHYGKYGEIGDIVRVVGTFHVDCAEHVGDIDIHANSVEITTGGSAAVHEIDTFKLYIAVGIITLGLLLGLLYWRLSERLR